MRLSLDFVALSVDSSKFVARELHDTFVYLAFQPLVFEEGALATILAPNGCWTTISVRRSSDGEIRRCLAVRKLLGATRPISM